eukprot:TRINITY_DN14419_c0_g1_i3.p1 TRINITY_DN14419_c0_g1~~TRINITY_DN14419_c0_g1_i3.p1  ORF type:complete len:372 (-),score=22.08 TRINITY_DN14419_c0_g1_i3:13-1128(-)
MQMESHGRRQLPKPTRKKARQDSHALRRMLTEFDFLTMIGAHVGPGCLLELSSLSVAVRPLAEAVMVTVLRQYPKLVFVCGGKDIDGSMNSVEVFDTTSQSWSLTTPMLESRFQASAAVLMNKLYVCGGRGVGGANLSTVERYNPLNGMWEAMPRLPRSSYMACAAACGRYLYICGGAWQGNGCKTIERFDGFCLKWETLPSIMRNARKRACACAIQSRIYICGGLGDAGGFYRSVECLDVGKGVFIDVPSMIQPRSGCVAVGVAGKLYVCAGWACTATERSNFHGNELVGTGEVFDPCQGSWTFLDVVSSRPVGFLAATAYSGRILLLGGLDELVEHSEAADSFDPGSEVKAIPSMNFGRMDCVAGTLLC